MRRPRLFQKFRKRDGCGNFLVEDDGVAEFPDAQAEKKSERERVKFRRGKIFHRVKAAISADRLQAQALLGRWYGAAAGFAPALPNFLAPDAG